MWRRLCVVFAYATTAATLHAAEQAQSSNVALDRSGVYAQSVDARPAHGTVNVFLANKNGLVVVTDSLLSNGSGRVGLGQKLFQVDDRTICSIAGWYSDPGPQIKPDDADSPSYPAYLGVPDIMWAITSDPSFASESIDRKVEILSNAFAFSLLAVASWNETSGTPRTLAALEMKSEITVAGFDKNGVIEILQTDLIPEIKDARIIDYEIYKKMPVIVAERSGAVSVIRGIPATAELILSGAYPFMNNDPILGYFKSSLDQDKGGSLSLLDMEQIAKQIERQTERQFPRLVGGSRQIAILSAGKVSEFIQPIQSTHQMPHLLFNRIARMTLSGVRHSFIYTQGGGVVFAQGMTLSDGPQVLDNIFFFKSAFSRVALKYSGSPRTIFDKSNTVSDSTLTLLPGVDPGSNFVKQIKRDFPALTIIDQTRPPQP